MHAYTRDAHRSRRDDRIGAGRPRRIRQSPPPPGGPAPRPRRPRRPRRGSGPRARARCVRPHRRRDGRGGAGRALGGGSPRVALTPAARRSLRPHQPVLSARDLRPASRRVGSIGCRVAQSSDPTRQVSRLGLNGTTRKSCRFCAYFVTALHAAGTSAIAVMIRSAIRGQVQPPLRSRIAPTIAGPVEAIR